MFCSIISPSGYQDYNFLSIELSAWNASPVSHPLPPLPSSHIEQVKYFVCLFSKESSLLCVGGSFAAGTFLVGLWINLPDGNGRGSVTQRAETLGVAIIMISQRESVQ